MKVVCDIKDRCGVCPSINTDYDKSLKKKEAFGLGFLKNKGLLESTRVLRTIPSPRKVGYRTIFKLVVGPASNQHGKAPSRFRFGLYTPGTHDLGPDLTSCPLHTAPLRKLLKLLHPVLESSGLQPYDENQQVGHLKYLIARSNQEGTELMMTWVVAKPMERELSEITQRLLEKELPIQVVAMNIHQGTSNAIWGEQTFLLTQQRSISEKISDITLELGPTSFFQVNPWQAENIYRRIRAIGEKQSKRQVAWDLFSGLGPISCLLGGVFENVLSVEENSEATQLGKLNTEKNGLNQKVSIQCGLVEKCLQEVPVRFSEPDVIIANPSRRGIHGEARSVLINTLRRLQKTELVYMSCSLESFTRDLIEFKSHGLELFELQAFDMFAQTDQLEWLGRIRLQKKRGE